MVIRNSSFVEGREYLSHFHKALMVPGSSPRVVFSGDSTTDGHGSTTPYRIWELIPTIAEASGISIQSINAGHGGKTTSDWVNTYLAEDLLQSPDVYVIRWGINDQYHGSTAEQFDTNLRSGLETIRASFSLAQMSIILMPPNSINYPEILRDQAWVDSIHDYIREAALDYQCCFVDCYHYLYDSPHGQDWLDTNLVHPQNVANLWISSLLGEVLFPMGVVAQLGSDTRKTFPNGFNSQSPSGVQLQPSLAPPVPGTLYGLRQVDGVAAYYCVESVGVAALGYVGRNARGTQSAPIPVGYSNILNQIVGWGWDGTGFGMSGQVALRAYETFTPTSRGGYCTINLVAPGTTTAGETFRSVGNGATYFPKIGTTVCAPNAFLDPGSSPANQILRSVSSLACKDHIENLEDQEAERVIMSLRPVKFHSKCEADQVPAPGTKDGIQSFLGLIAEEVAAVDPRLAHWTYPEDAFETVTVFEDPDGSRQERRLKSGVTREHMVPDGVQYDRLVVPLIQLVQSQQDRIDSLLKRVEDLESLQQ